MEACLPYNGVSQQPQPTHIATNAVKTPAHLCFIGNQAPYLKPLSQLLVVCLFVARLLKLSPEVEGSLPYNGFYYQAQPPNIATNAFMQRVEGDIWTAAVGGFNNQGPRAKMSDVMAFIEQVYEPTRPGC